jgi:hypothetical protein
MTSLYGEADIDVRLPAPQLIKQIGFCAFFSRCTDSTWSTALALNKPKNFFT